MKHDRVELATARQRVLDIEERVREEALEEAWPIGSEVRAIGGKLYRITDVEAGPVPKDPDDPVPLYYWGQNVAHHNPDPMRIVLMCSRPGGRE